MKKTAKLATALSKARSKPKGKMPSKKEQAQMLAMRQLGMGNYEIAGMMNRSPHTVQKYCESPLFTDPKFAKMVEEYKEKELIDLTSLNIVSRARLHELAPTMNPIEAIALMDRSFQQRRLLEGKSTENISSLRRIISEAHGVSDAFQKQSPGEIPVRQQSHSGEGVCEPHTKHEETTTKEEAIEEAQIVSVEHIRPQEKEDSAQ